MYFTHYKVAGFVAPSNKDRLHDRNAEQARLAADIMGRSIFLPNTILDCGRSHQALSSPQKEGRR